MKVLYLPAKSKADLIPVIEKALPMLQGKIGITTTIQHLYKIKEVKKYLDEKGINSVICGQVLGCNVKAATQIKCDMYLYIGSGQFHPLKIKMETKKPVIIANPLNNFVSKVSDNEIEKYEKRLKAAYSKFLFSENIGVLVSTKPGQKNIKSIYELEKRFPKKKFYILLTNTLNFQSLEDFNFVQCFVNTMCPRLMDDYDKFPKAIINYEDVINYENIINRRGK